jgi:hypothetical protein
MISGSPDRAGNFAYRRIGTNPEPAPQRRTTLSDVRVIWIALAAGATAGCTGYVSEVEGPPHLSGGVGGSGGGKGGASGGERDAAAPEHGGTGGVQTDAMPEGGEARADAETDAPADGPSTGTEGGPTGEVPPIIAPECPGDLTQGFTEYQDTFVVQHPYDVMAEDRYSFENGIYTIWVFKGDKPHEPGNTTRERTEFRWSNMSSGVHVWSGDFKVDANSEHVCIFQVKNSGPPTGVYLRVDHGSLHQLGGPNFLSGIYDEWFNLKVVVDIAAATGKVYINNCLKQTVNMPRGSGTWYFKNGTYTCDSTVCRDHFKNIHLYVR